MRVLLLSQFCYPEPDFKILPFAKKIKKEGFEVEILTGYPNYTQGIVYPKYKNRWAITEFIDDIKINRVPLFIDHSSSAIKRIINYFSFAFSACFLGPFMIKRPGIIYAYHAPATIAIPAIFFKFIYRSKIVYDINDYWPDSLTATGMINNKQLIKLISIYCRFTYHFFDKITVVSKGFREKLIKDNVPLHKISVIYNWPHPIN